MITAAPENVDLPAGRPIVRHGAGRHRWPQTAELVPFPVRPDFRGRARASSRCRRVRGWRQESYGINTNSRWALLSVRPRSSTPNRPVHLWFACGSVQPIALSPVAQGRHLASLLPNPVVHEIPGDGHLLIFAQFDDILSSLVSAVSA